MNTPVIDVSPIVLKDAILTLGEAGYQKHVSDVTFTPSAQKVTWHGLTKDSAFTDTGLATWVCELGYAQDWKTTNSLSRYLYAHEGEKVPATFQPVNGDGPSFTATLIITPGAIGGKVNSVATATVTLGCQARPELVDAAPSAPSIDSIDPATGGTAGGDLVTITGSGFTGATAVKFGDADAGAFQVGSDTAIYATSPAGTAGDESVTVTGPGGTSDGVTFTYAD